MISLALLIQCFDYMSTHIALMIHGCFAITLRLLDWLIDIAAHRFAIRRDDICTGYNSNKYINGVTSLKADAMEPLPFISQCILRVLQIGFVFGLTILLFYLISNPLKAMLQWWLKFPSDAAKQYLFALP